MDVAGGQLAEARAQLDEALDVSLAIQFNRNMALCVVALARLAFGATQTISQVPFLRRGEHHPGGLHVTLR